MNKGFEVDICNRFLPRRKIGVRQFITYNLGVGPIPMPADTGVYVIYILEGEGSYNQQNVKKGDVLALGMNKEPLIGFSKCVKLFIIEMDFDLFYEITGIFPLYCKYVITFNDSDPLKCLGELFLKHPVESWIDLAEEYICQLIRKNIYGLSGKVERILYTTNLIKSDLHTDIKTKLACIGVSSRQIERDFKEFLGMTPKEYERIVRFYQALDFLKYTSMAEAAAHSGYWDQSHMTREFKKLSVWTPIESINFKDGLLAHTNPQYDMGRLIV